MDAVSLATCLFSIHLHLRLPFYGNNDKMYVLSIENVGGLEVI